ncbi:hypothetical protein DFH06DRAFT_1219181 [Mycena polygramma]|nr:hypothetical protein DFH06DRAFT_1219181 [Mycena polygramma]
MPQLIYFDMSTRCLWMISKAVQLVAAAVASLSLGHREFRRMCVEGRWIVIFTASEVFSLSPLLCVRTCGRGGSGTSTWGDILHLECTH